LDPANAAFLRFQMDEDDFTGWSLGVVHHPSNVGHRRPGGLSHGKIFHIPDAWIATRLSTLLLLGLWHSARPVVYGIVGVVTSSWGALMLDILELDLQALSKMGETGSCGCGFTPSFMQWIPQDANHCLPVEG